MLRRSIDSENLGDHNIYNNFIEMFLKSSISSLLILLLNIIGRYVQMSLIICWSIQNLKRHDILGGEKS